LAISSEVNVSPTITDVHDCSTGFPMIFGGKMQFEELTTCTRNRTGIPLSGVVLEAYIKSST